MAAVLVAACGGAKEGAVAANPDAATVAAPVVSSNARALAIASPSQGRWGSVVNLPLIPVAASSLPDGKVLMWSADEKFGFASTGLTYFATFDPTTGGVTERLVSETGHNMFCPGTVNLPDGRLLVSGGGTAAVSSLFTPSTNQWSRGANMVTPRGYHTTTLLQDGSVLALGGSWSGGEGGKNGELWTSAGGWRALPGVPVEPFVYPDAAGIFRADNHMTLLTCGNGRVLHVGPSRNMHWISTTGAGSVTDAGPRGDDEDSQSASVVMLAPGKILKTGGSHNYDNTEANANSYLIDASSGLTVRKLTPMAYRRAFHNSVVMPNGQVMVVGGQTYAQPFSDNNSVLVPELWDPATERFTPLAPIATPRNYHSVALLLPDARVLSAGGGLCGAGCAGNHPDLQIYTPHYLLKPDGTPAVRPVITTAPATLQYGRTVTVNTDSAVSSFALVRLSSTTHTVNNDQRRVVLTMRATGTNTYAVDVPSNPGWALPGDWMLFALNADGTPSVAKIVRLSQAGAPAIAPIDDQSSTMGAAVTLQPAVTVPGGGAASVSASGLPAGLGIDAATGRIQGAPTATGRSLVTVRATAGGVTTSTEFLWNVNAPGSTRFVKLEALSEVNGNPWSSAAEIKLLGSDGLPLARTGWSASADSEDTATTAANAIDGNPATLWHTQWVAANPPPPHRLVINLGTGVEVTGLAYLPRQDGITNGGIARYNIYLSSDGVNWGNAVASGNFADLGGAAAAEKTIYFNNVARGKPAVQSSTFEVATAARAVDGNIDGSYGAGSVSTTAAENNAWWEVDLGASHSLQAVRLWNRTDCCSDRLSNFHLLASDTPLQGRTLAQLLADPTVWHTQYSGTAGRATLINTPSARGRYVRVQLAGTNNLQLAEVQVHGKLATNRPPTMATPPAMSTVQGTGANLSLSASDADGDALSYSATGLPPGLAVSASTGVISGTPTTEGAYVVLATVNDGRGGSTAVRFNWTITAPAPVLQPVATQITSVGTTLSFTAATATTGTYTYQWSFGDGSAATAWSSSPNTSHSYASAGVYLVTVTARTADGRSTTRSLWQAVQGPVGQAGRSSSPLLLEPRSGAAPRLWVVNPDNDSVSVFDTATRARLAEIRVGTHPTTLALAPDGRVWVVNNGSTTLSLIAPATLAVVQTVSLARASQPYGVVIRADGTAFVAHEALGQITRVAANGTPSAPVALGGRLRHLALHSAGGALVVPRFVTPPLPGEGTALVQTSVNGAPRGGEVLVVDATTLAMSRTVVLQHSEKPDSTTQGRGVPNYLGAPVFTPDGRSVWVPGKQDNIKRGKLRDGLELDFQNTLRAISSRIDVATQSEDLAARVDHDNAGLASAIATHPSGAYLFVALETSRHIAVMDPLGRRELFRVDSGRAPQGLVVSDDGLTLYAFNFMDRSVGVYDLTRLVRYGESALPLAATLSSVGTEKLSAQVLKGKQLFYDARDPRLARDGYLSCAACHADGGHDGRTWDFTGFGEGLRNTIALRGRAGAMGRLHWSANFDEVQDFEGQIRRMGQGTGLMSDAQFNTGSRSLPLGDRKAGVSADLDALAAYVSSLNSFDASPHRAADGSLTAAGLAGRAVYQSRCAACHGGSDFTDSAAGVVHNVGTLNAASGSRLGSVLSGLDTPTLRDAWSGGPWLHNGSAATLEAAITAHNVFSLNATDLANVAAFVRQIGREEPAVPAPTAVRSSLLYGPALGIAFSDSVGPNQSVTGIAGRVSTVIDQLQALATPTNLPAHGGSGGSAGAVSFPAGVTLVRIFGSTTAAGVVQIGFGTSDGWTYGPFGQATAGATAFDFTVPAGSRVVGFTGRASTTLNAIGVLYQP